MKPTDIGGGHWLDEPAADAYLRMCADGCPGGVTDAGRTTADQAALFRRYFTTDYAASAKFDRREWNGVVWWRRIGMPSAAIPDSPAANHQKGNALDLPEPARSWVAAHGAAYGWISGRVPGEAWHKEYIAAADVHHVSNPIHVPVVPVVPTVPTGPAPLAPLPVEDPMLQTILYLYLNVVGRPASPQEAFNWLRQLRNQDEVAALDAFLGCPPEGASVTAAFHEFLGRAAGPAEVDNWVKQPTIRAIRDGVRNSREAKDRRGEK